MKKIIIIINSLLVILSTSCSDEFLNNENKEYVSMEQILTLAESSPEALLIVTNGVLGGQYSFMREYNTWTPGNGRHDDFGQKAVDLGLDLMSNDMVQVRSHWFIHYYNYVSRTEPASNTHTIWNFYYRIIYGVSLNINIIPEDTDDKNLQYSLGRSLALRAFSYFNLVRIYQNTYINNQNEPGVMISTGKTFDPQPRSSVDSVYRVILSDLSRAHTLLDGYERTSKSEIDQKIVAGLLSRVYLERQEWGLAAQYANEARQGETIMSKEDWMAGFTDINNEEWMWGADINSETATTYASYYSHIANLSPGYAGALGIYKSIDKRLYDSIPITDVRKSAFAGASDASLPMYANKKFYDRTFFEGDYVYMRSSELYLNEAEALAEGGNDVEAQDLLFEFVSVRDSGYVKSSRTGDALVEEIRLQRRIELWGEGFAWFDMKRWGVPLQRDYNGSNHTAQGLLNIEAEADEFRFQLPEDEMKINTVLTDSDQNP